MVGVNEVGIRWKDNVLIRGGLTDASNSFFVRKKRSKACREKSAEVIVLKVRVPIGKDRIVQCNSK